MAAEPPFGHVVGEKELGCRWGVAGVKAEVIWRRYHDLVNKLGADTRMVDLDKLR